MLVEDVYTIGWRAVKVGRSRRRLDPMSSLALFILAGLPKSSFRPPHRFISRRISPRLEFSLFPESDAKGGDSDLFETQSLDDVDESDVIGFWTIYDPLVSEDAEDQEKISDQLSLSARIVLRADGATSRQSKFPGGTWSLEKGDGSQPPKIRIVQKNIRFSLEWRYEGEFVSFEVPKRDIADQSQQVDPSWERTNEMVNEIVEMSQMMNPGGSDNLDRDKVIEKLSEVSALLRETNWENITVSQSPNMEILKDAPVARSSAEAWKAYNDTQFTLDMNKANEELDKILSEDKPSDPDTSGPESSRLKVFGDASLWDVSNATAPVQIGSTQPFTMDKRVYDPDKVFMVRQVDIGPLDPESIRQQEKIKELQKELSRVEDAEEIAALKQLVSENPRKRKQEEDLGSQ